MLEPAEIVDPVPIGLSGNSFPLGLESDLISLPNVENLDPAQLRRGTKGKVIKGGRSQIAMIWGKHGRG